MSAAAFKLQQIEQRLLVLQAERRVRILYACESGSRAWGFASPDSDYDVRFIYARDREWYLAFDVEQRRDVIEQPIVDDIDCSGWDIRKALYLFTRTNGALLEWLNSPTVYVEHGPLANRMRQLAPEAFNPVALCYHYSHMARGNAREYLLGDQVRLKKYFYVLRPLLAIRWIQEGRGLPPVEFSKLVDAVCPVQLRPDIASLVERKRSTPELGLGDPIPGINAFIAAELDRHGGQFSGQGRPDIVSSTEVCDRLNEIFRECIA